MNKKTNTEFVIVSGKSLEELAANVNAETARRLADVEAMEAEPVIDGDRRHYRLAWDYLGGPRVAGVFFQSVSFDVYSYLLEEEEQGEAALDAAALLLAKGAMLDGAGCCVYCESLIVEVGQGGQAARAHAPGCEWAALRDAITSEAEQ